jgi:hypothetical protein
MELIRLIALGLQVDARLAGAPLNDAQALVEAEMRLWAYHTTPVLVRECA